MNNYAIIVAGGSGLRMGSNVAKQFLLLKSKPVLMHTIKQFATCKQIILVLPLTQVSYWKQLCEDYQFKIPHTIVYGGNERFFSVLNGLAILPDDAQGLVAVHDGVRPCVTPQTINLSFSEAAIHQSAITSIPLKDSIRMVDGDACVALDRSKYCLIQTPQTFNLMALKNAYSQINYQTHFTDDASVFEAAGNTIHLIKGEYRNIKITTPDDLPLAELYTV